MSATKAKTKKRKRSYNNDPLTKIDSGKPWAYNLEVAPDVTKKIVEERQKYGGRYDVIMNNRLRKAYGLPKPENGVN